MSELIYVADPMCSWCYAFRPVLDRIRNEFDLPVRLVLGGLFVDAEVLELDNNLRAYLRRTWNRVGAMSNQPISYRLLEWESWRYDTEPSCRAVVAARALDEAAATRLFDRVQTAFYAEGVDVTDPAVYPELAEAVGIDGVALATKMQEEDVITATRADFGRAVELGVNGFPTLFVERDGEPIPVTVGYQPAEQVLRTLSVLSS